MQPSSRAAADRPIYDQLGDFVGAIGSRDFDLAYIQLFQDLIDIDDCNVFAFSGRSAPRAIIAQSAWEDRQSAMRLLAHDYISGGYRTDPNLKSAGEDIFVRDAADIQDKAYRRHYWEEPAVTSKLAVMGSKADTLYYASFYKRSSANPFCQNDIALMKELSGFIVKTLHRHSLLLGAKPTLSNLLTVRGDVIGREHTLAQLRTSLRSAPHLLSEREADVCARIIMGYSSLAIALTLSISVHTVATHRKRAYSKLGISSQNELFARFFNNAVSEAPVPA